MKKQNKNILVKIILIAVLLILFAFLDFIMLEKVYKPLSLKFNIPWSAFEVNILGVSLLWWSIAFFILIFAVYIILAIAMKDWKVGVSGILLFMFGWEDIFYYLIQGQWLPAQLPWLDSSPLMGLTRFFTEGHVSSFGVLLSGIIGVILVFLIFKYFKKN